MRVNHVWQGGFTANSYQEQATTHVTYHHIELETHDVVMAVGLPVESFLDTGNRNMFDSLFGLVVLHPDFAASYTTAFAHH